MLWIEACYDLSWTTTQAGGVFITEREQTLESSLQRCVVNTGISLLCDWDVFAFLYRHVTSLTTTDQIARLVGYETSVVGGALDRLESRKLIERSRPSHRGVRLYRALNSKEIEHQRSLEQLITLSESRAGRLELAKALSPIRPSCVRGPAIGQSPESEGKSLCPKV